MAKKSNELNEDEKLNESDVKVENNNESVTSKKEKTEVMKEENIEKVQIEKVPTVKEIFRDKYDAKVIYNIGDTFILDENLNDKKPVKVNDKQYKVSKERYEELKRSLYVD